MPTVLGLTTDPSPHGLNAKDGHLSGEAQGKAAGHASGAMTLSRGNEQKQMQKQESTEMPQKKKKKQTQEQQRQALNNHDNPNKPKKRELHSISARNHAAARDMDMLFWRAMCDDPVETMDYMAPDVALVSPLLFGSAKAVTRKSKDPSLKEALEGLGSFTGFRIQEMETIEAALMAVSSMYRMTLGRQGEDGEERVEVMVHSTWRQEAGADWFLVGQLIAEANLDG